MPTAKKPAKKAVKKAAPKRTATSTATKAKPAAKKAKKKVVKKRPVAKKAAPRRAATPKPATMGETVQIRPDRSGDARKAAGKRGITNKRNSVRDSPIDLAAVITMQDTPQLERIIRQMHLDGHPEAEAVDILAEKVFALRQGQEQNTKALQQLIKDVQTLDGRISK